MKPNQIQIKNKPINHKNHFILLTGHAGTVGAVVEASPVVAGVDTLLREGGALLDNTIFRVQMVEILKFPVLEYNILSCKLLISC